MLVLYPVAVLTSFLSGGFKQSITLLFLGFWYNDCGGADRNCVLRNLINGAGFICYTSGAMEVAYGSTVPLNGPLLRWFAIIGTTVASTVQTQDMYDQAGDSVRHRQTVPLVLGDAMSRWTIAVPVVIWSCVCPWLWGCGYGYIAPISLGSMITYRVLAKRSVVEDKMTFRVWNAWMIAVYLLPLIRFTRPAS